MIGQLRRARAGIIKADNNNWNEFTDTFNRDFRSSLRLLANILSYHWNEEVIPEEELSTIQSEIEEITFNVVQSSIDSELKRVLVENLNGVRDAILGYQLSGAEGIRNAVDRTITSLIRYREEFRKVSDSADKETFMTIGNVLRTLDTLMSRYRSLKPILGPVSELLALPAVDTDANG